MLYLLMESVESCLSCVNESICFTDSLIVLHWIKGVEKNWIPFVQNRVKEIRERVTSSCCSHMKGKSNPADLASRGTTLKELEKSEVWFQGPLWQTWGEYLGTCT